VPETLHTKNLLALAAEAVNQLTQLVSLLKPITKEKKKRLERPTLLL
jgi:hypothetical protein